MEVGDVMLECRCPCSFNLGAKLTWMPGFLCVDFSLLWKIFLISLELGFTRSWFVQLAGLSHRKVGKNLSSQSITIVQEMLPQPYKMSAALLSLRVYFSHQFRLSMQSAFFIKVSNLCTICQSQREAKMVTEFLPPFLWCHWHLIWWQFLNQKKMISPSTVWTALFHQVY